MGYKVEGSTITLTRGDSFRTQVNIALPDGTPYFPVEGEKVRFALKSSKMKYGNTDFVDETPRIFKNIPISTMLLELEPEDTKGLPFGWYKYDVQITRLDGYIDTFIKNADFFLDYEVD